MLLGVQERHVRKSFATLRRPLHMYGMGHQPVSIGSLDGRSREPLTLSNVSYVDLTWDEHTKRSKSVKRPKTEKDSPQVERVAVGGSSAAKQEKILSLFKRLDKNIKNLKKVVENNRNTKVEIKDITQQIASVMSQLYTDDIQSLIQQKSSAETTHVLSQETTNSSRKPTRDCGTQYNVEDKNVEAITRKERICKAIDMGSDDEEMREVINLKWDEELFTVSSMVKDDIPIEDDVIVIIDKVNKDRD